MADKKLKRVDPNDAPAGVRTEAYNRAADEYNKTTRPRYPAEMDYRGHKAGVEAANEYAREANRAQVMQKVNYPEEKGPSKQSMQEAADEAMRRREESAPTTRSTMGEGLKKGGKVKKCASGGSVKTSSASARADGCAIRGKTRGKVL